MRDTSIYKDINQFSPTKRPYSLDERAVYQSVINIVRTSFNAIPFTSWGSSLEDQLFELYDERDAVGILMNITGAIEDFEPNVSFEISESSIEFLDTNHSLKIILVFTVEGLQGERFELNEVITF